MNTRSRRNTRSGANAAADNAQPGVSVKVEEKTTTSSKNHSPAEVPISVREVRVAKNTAKSKEPKRAGSYAVATQESDVSNTEGASSTGIADSPAANVAEQDDISGSSNSVSGSKMTSKRCSGQASEGVASLDSKGGDLPVIVNTATGEDTGDSNSPIGRVTRRRSNRSAFASSKMKAEPSPQDEENGASGKDADPPAADSVVNASHQQIVSSNDTKGAVITSFPRGVGVTRSGSPCLRPSSGIGGTRARKVSPTLGEGEVSVASKLQPQGRGRGKGRGRGRGRRGCGRSEVGLNTSISQSPGKLASEDAGGEESVDFQEMTSDLSSSEPGQPGAEGADASRVYDAGGAYKNTVHGDLNVELLIASTVSPNVSAVIRLKTDATSTPNSLNTELDSAPSGSGAKPVIPAGRVDEFLLPASSSADCLELDGVKLAAMGMGGAPDSHGEQPDSEVSAVQQTPSPCIRMTRKRKKDEAAAAATTPPDIESHQTKELKMGTSASLEKQFPPGDESDTSDKRLKRDESSLISKQVDTSSASILSATSSSHEMPAALNDDLVPDRTDSPGPEQTHGVPSVPFSSIIAPSTEMMTVQNKSPDTIQCNSNENMEDVPLPLHQDENAAGKVDLGGKKGADISSETSSAIKSKNQQIISPEPAALATPDREIPGNSGSRSVMKEVSPASPEVITLPDDDDEEAFSAPISSTSHDQVSRRETADLSEITSKTDNLESMGGGEVSGPSTRRRSARKKGASPGSVKLNLAPRGLPKVPVILPDDGPEDDATADLRNENESVISVDLQHNDKHNVDWGSSLNSKLLESDGDAKSASPTMTNADEIFKRPFAVTPSNIDVDDSTSRDPDDFQNTSLKHNQSSSGLNWRKNACLSDEKETSHSEKMQSLESAEKNGPNSAASSAADSVAASRLVAGLSEQAPVLESLIASLDTIAERIGEFEKAQETFETSVVAPRLAKSKAGVDRLCAAIRGFDPSFRVPSGSALLPSRLETGYVTVLKTSDDPLSLWYRFPFRLGQLTFSSLAFALEYLLCLQLGRWDWALMVKAFPRYAFHALGLNGHLTRILAADPDSSAMTKESDGTGDGPSNRKSKQEFRKNVAPIGISMKMARNTVFSLLRHKMEQCEPFAIAIREARVGAKIYQCGGGKKTKFSPPGTCVSLFGTGISMQEFVERWTSQLNSFSVKSKNADAASTANPAETAPRSPGKNLYGIWLEEFIRYEKHPESVLPTPEPVNFDVYCRVDRYSIANAHQRLGGGGCAVKSLVFWDTGPQGYAVSGRNDTELVARPGLRLFKTKTSGTPSTPDSTVVDILSSAKYRERLEEFSAIILFPGQADFSDLADGKWHFDSTTVMSWLNDIRAIVPVGLKIFVVNMWDADTSRGAHMKRELKLQVVKFNADLAKAQLDLGDPEIFVLDVNSCFRAGQSPKKSEHSPEGGGQLVSAGHQLTYSGLILLATFLAQNVPFVNLEVSLAVEQKLRKSVEEHRTLIAKGLLSGHAPSEFQVSSESELVKKHGLTTASPMDNHDGSQDEQVEILAQNVAVKRPAPFLAAGVAGKAAKRPALLSALDSGTVVSDAGNDSAAEKIAAWKRKSGFGPGSTSVTSPELVKLLDAHQPVSSGLTAVSGEPDLIATLVKTPLISGSEAIVSKKPPALLACRPSIPAWRPEVDGPRQAGPRPLVGPGRLRVPPPPFILPPPPPIPYVGFPPPHPMGLRMGPTPGVVGPYGIPPAVPYLPIQPSATVEPPVPASYYAANFGVEHPAVARLQAHEVGSPGEPAASFDIPGGGDPWVRIPSPSSSGGRSVAGTSATSSISKQGRIVGAMTGSTGVADPKRPEVERYLKNLPKGLIGTLKQIMAKKRSEEGAGTSQTGAVAEVFGEAEETEETTTIVQHRTSHRFSSSSLSLDTSIPPPGLIRPPVPSTSTALSTAPALLPSPHSSRASSASGSHHSADASALVLPRQRQVEIAGGWGEQSASTGWGRSFSRNPNRQSDVTSLPGRPDFGPVISGPHAEFSPELMEPDNESVVSDHSLNSDTQKEDHVRRFSGARRKIGDSGSHHAPEKLPLLAPAPAQKPRMVPPPSLQKTSNPGRVLSPYDPYDDEYNVEPGHQHLSSPVAHYGEPDWNISSNNCQRIDDEQPSSSTSQKNSSGGVSLLDPISLSDIERTLGIKFTPEQQAAVASKLHGGAAGASGRGGPGSVREGRGFGSVTRPGRASSKSGGSLLPPPPRRSDTSQSPIQAGSVDAATVGSRASGSNSRPQTKAELLVEMAARLKSNLMSASDLDAGQSSSVFPAYSEYNDYEYSYDEQAYRVEDDTEMAFGAGELAEDDEKESHFMYNASPASASYPTPRGTGRGRAGKSGSGAARVLGGSHPHRYSGHVYAQGTLPRQHDPSVFMSTSSDEPSDFDQLGETSALFNKPSPQSRTSTRQSLIPGGPPGHSESRFVRPRNPPSMTSSSAVNMGVRFSSPEFHNMIPGSERSSDPMGAYNVGELMHRPPPPVMSRGGRMPSNPSHSRAAQAAWHSQQRGVPRVSRGHPRGQPLQTYGSPRARGGILPRPVPAPAAVAHGSFAPANAAHQYLQDDGSNTEYEYYGYGDEYVLAPGSPQ